jgi:hypothetical protein
VTLSIANHDASLPVAYRLYLPKEWANDRKRRRKVGVPDEISFKTKPEIALAQIRWACEAGLSRGAVLMDAGYGVDTDLRTSITALGLSYVAGIQSHTTVWAPGTGPRPPKKWSGHGRPPKLLRRDVTDGFFPRRAFVAMSANSKNCRRLTCLVFNRGLDSLPTGLAPLSVSAAIKLNGDRSCSGMSKRRS